MKKLLENIITEPLPYSDFRNPVTRCLTSDKELDLLYSLIEGGTCDFTQTVFEIGTWRGGTARKLAAKSYLSGKLFVTCDPGRNPEIDEMFEPIKNIVTYYQDGSLNVLKGLNNIWMCYVDGLHEQNQVKKEITALYPKIAQGGRIAFHDCSRVEGVDKAIDNYKSENPDHFKEETSPCEIIRILKKEN